MAAEKYSLTIGVLEARGRPRVTTIAVNFGEALQIVSKRDVILVEQSLGLGTLGPDMGEPIPRVLTELLSANMSEMTRLKVKGKNYPQISDFGNFFVSVQAKDGLLKITPALREALAYKKS